MAKYFGHKPSWRSSQSSNATAPVLNFERQPSGVHEYRGNKTSVPPSGRKAGSRSVGRPTSQWKSMQKMKQRLAGFASKANIAYAVADAMGNPEVMDYGWDDFMEGRLPPPFDWLNSDIPPEWLPTKTPRKETTMPEGSRFFENAAGRWWGISPGIALNGAHFHPLFNGVDFAWPPPGRNGDIRPEVKYSPNLYTDIPWDTVVEGVPNWTATTHDLQDNGSAREPVWRLQQKVYSKRDAGPVQGMRSAFVAYFEYFVPRSSGIPAPPVPQPVPGVINDGDTLAEASVIVAEGESVWTPVLPTLAPKRHPYQNLFKEIAGTRVVDIPVPDPVGEGGTRVIAPPGGPVIVVPTKPGEPPHPPGNGTKERKRLVGGAAFFFTQKVFHGITEYTDLVDALFEAIPKQHRCKTKSLAGKSACIFMKLDKVDIGDAIVNVAWNQFEDWVIGTQLFARNKKAAEARGDRYAFRTLNSANDYGGLNALGEAYGEFSKEYVNPTKQNLKDFLTKRFGI